MSPWILSFKVKYKDLSPPLFIEEVAQAKRSDGGVLKVEQPGGPLAVEEFKE